MNDIKSAGLLICILMVLMAYLKQAIPKGKSTYLMKAIISIFILLSVVQGIRNLNFESLKTLFYSGYSRSNEVWSQAAEMIEVGLKEEFQNYLEAEEINALVVSVSVEVNQETFEIKKVIVSGNEAETARNLLAGRYQIGIAYIEVKNE